MRVSIDEVTRRAQWLLRARGLLCGNEDEPAEAVAWLSARVDGVLEGLHGELAGGALGPAREAMPAPRILGHTPVGLELDACGASALCVAPLLLDWVTAAPAEAVLDAANLRSPGWLLPHLARRPTLSPVLLQVRGEGDDGHWSMSLWRDCGALGLCMGRPWSDLWGGGPVRLHLSRSAPGPAGAEASASEVDLADLERRALHSLAHGVQVDSDLWTALGHITSEAMVPESEASRARGAG